MRRLTLPFIVFICQVFHPAGFAVAAEEADTPSQPTNKVAEPPSDKSLLPKWLKFSALERGRMEAPFGVGFKKGADQLYYLNRIRLDMTIKPVSWLQFYVQGQDNAGFRL